MMQTSYDPEADAMVVWFPPEGAKSVETKEVAPGILLDVDTAGSIIGIEVLDVRERITGQHTQAACGRPACQNRLPEQVGIDHAGGINPNRRRCANFS